ncbi:lytic polysaccharide monooxygenase [Rothia uropygioeca]|uniref:lytic polysaccharide monooxygenase n=1 Tax=Kocuria sp. 257 TaxID=2021970 RepID=UPI0010109DCF|nr:lytic polysaccharide monooxygenase [Kocuria sp. 257]
MKKSAKFCTVATLVGALAFGGAAAANAHGYIGNSKSDVTARAAMKSNTNLGPVQYEPQSIEAPKGFSLDASTGGPADGKLASAGTDIAKNLDEQSPDRWKENEVNAGQTISMGWEYTAMHPTSKWHYYITKNGWDQNSPLKRSELQPLATVQHDGTPPTEGTVHQMKLPADHTGDHVIYAVWDVADTSNAFYNTVDVHINGDAEPEKPDTEAPSAPSSLTANNVTSTGVQLTWKESTDNVDVDHYEIQRRTKGGDFKKVGSTAGTSFKDKDLTASTAYDYRVVAFDAAGNASDPGTLSVTTKNEDVNPGPDTEAPSAPSHVHSMGTTANSVDLMWSKADDNVGIDHYEIQRAISGGEFAAIGTTDKTSHMDEGLNASTSYDYRVVAVDAAGNESPSSEVFTVRTRDDSTPETEQWSSTAAYKKGDRVLHNGSVFEAVQDYQGHGDPTWINALSLWKKID